MSRSTPMLAEPDQDEWETEAAISIADEREHAIGPIELERRGSIESFTPGLKGRLPTPLLGADVDELGRRANAGSG